MGLFDRLGDLGSALGGIAAAPFGLGAMALGAGAGNAVGGGLQKTVKPPNIGDDNYNPRLDPNSGYNTALGMYPGGMSPLNQDTGLLKDQYRLQYNPESLQNKTAYGDMLGSYALSKGPSEQAKYLQQSQDLNQQNAMQNATQQNRGALSSSYSDLASHGGLSSGARERLASGGARNLSQTTQGIANQGMQNKLGILSQDEAGKLGALGQAQGFSNQNFQNDLAKTQLGLGVQKYNTGNAMDAISNKNAQDLAKYQELMKAYGGDQQANATIRAS